MEFFEVVHARHSVRAYTDMPVEGEKLGRILDAANHAPSAGNLQGYEIYLVTQTEHRAALVRAALDQEFIAQAPLALVFCAHTARSAVWYEQRGIQLYCIQDATIACAYAQLAATALDLASVWVGAFDEEAVRQIIGAPEGHRPIIILPIGYPAKEPRLRPRRELSDLVHEV